MALTSRERICRTIEHKEVDRLPISDSAWEGTVRRWRREGLPPEADWEEYFGLDKMIKIFPDNSPRFEEKILEKTDRYRIVTTKWGTTEKQFNELDSTPEALDFYYSTPEKWEEAKERMLRCEDDRIPWEYLEKNYPKWRAEGCYLQLGLWFGFDVAHSRLTGTENMLLNMYEDPDWVKDIIDTYLQTSMQLCQRILDAGYEFDGVFWYDDMGYKNTTFFSPQMYREIVKPYHKRAVDFAHERGMKAELHSCGYIEPLLPDLLDIGVDMLNPLEVKAGMDPFALKDKYGEKLAFHGGINAQLWDHLELVQEEMRRIVPKMRENGGYIFASDHSIPNSVSFENMREIMKLARELGKNG